MFRDPSMNYLAASFEIDNEKSILYRGKRNFRIEESRIDEFVQVLENIRERTKFWMF